MTEQEWHECRDPRAMLDHLHDKASQRQRSLFAVACCRRFVPNPVSRPLIDLDCAQPLPAIEAEPGLLDLVTRLADEPVDAQVLAEFDELAKTLTEGWGFVAYGEEMKCFLQVLRGEEDPTWLSDAIADYFVLKFEAVCKSAGKLGCEVAWAAWEAVEFPDPFWQQIRSECENATTQSTWDGEFRWLAKKDEIEYAETMGRFRGPSAAWEDRWQSEWNATWERSWNKKWPPFSWDVSRPNLQFEAWERDALIRTWNDFVAEAPGIFWKYGRRNAWDAMSQFEFKMDPLKRALYDKLRAWTEKEIIAVISDCFGNQYAP